MIKEQVKKGELTVTQALDKLQKLAAKEGRELSKIHTAKWLARKLSRK